VIVLDSSILVAIIKGEEHSDRHLDLLATEDCAIGAPTLVETRAWCAMNLSGRRSRWLEELIAAGSMSVVPFSREMADVASRAFAGFGRASGHPAKLNFGDCMAYAVAVVIRAPLLFKGADFGRTDVMVHPDSIRT
jgi:ribonuclease VapC